MCKYCCTIKNGPVQRSLMQTIQCQRNLKMLRETTTACDVNTIDNEQFTTNTIYFSKAGKKVSIFHNFISTEVEDDRKQLIPFILL